MLYAELILLLLGLAVSAFFIPRSLRELRRMKDGEALSRWKSAPPQRKAAIRAAWRRGSAVADTEDAGLAVAMSEHVDRVVAATNRVSWWACAPLAPALLLVLGSAPRVFWAIVGIPVALLFASLPVTARSKKRRHRSIDLTTKKHPL